MILSKYKYVWKHEMQTRALGRGAGGGGGGGGRGGGEGGGGRGEGGEGGGEGGGGVADALLLGCPLLGAPEAPRLMMLSCFAALLQG